MKCNCNCNRNCNNNCGSNDSSNGGFNNRQGRGGFDRQRFLNMPNAFAAVSTDAFAVTAATTPTPLTLTNILYSYGNAIQAQADTSRIYITQPGLYQVSYFINGTNVAGGTATADFTAFLLRNTTQIAESTATVADGASAVLADTDIFYVACTDLPLTLTLNVTSSEVGSTFTFFITVNKICSCEGAFNGFGGTDQPVNLGGFFPGCQQFYSQPFTGPGPVIPGYDGYDGGFGCNSGGYGGCNSGCGRNSGGCNNGCWS